MTYEKFCQIMNNKMKPDDEKNFLINKIAEDPNRFIGVFRSTHPIVKLQQFITQSREIRFGDALEDVMSEFLQEMGYNIDKNKVIPNTDLHVDQLFSKENTLYFMEQKVRDDHDSTKKVGQIGNFKKKYIALQQNNPNKKICGIMYFLDDSFKKNKKYYSCELESMLNNHYDVHLFYGEDFYKFQHPANSNFLNKYNDLKKWLTMWKNDCMSTNLDLEITSSYINSLKHTNAYIWSKLRNSEIWNSIILQIVKDASNLES